MLHKNIQPLERHAPHTWEYVDAAERLAATGFGVNDLGKVAWQKDNNSFWVLTGYSPLSWASQSPVQSVFGRTGAVVAAPGDYTAAQVSFVAAGGLGSTNVQAALVELDSEKAAAVHTHVVADVAGLVDSLAEKELLANKATNFSVVNNTLYPTVQAVKTYADGLVVGLLDDRGSYNASGNVFPSTGGSGAAGAILKGDLWYISVAGTLGGVAVNVGDSIRALTDAPGQNAGSWAIMESNIGYVPENVANKVVSLSAGSTDTQYPSAKVVFDGLAGKAATVHSHVIADVTGLQTELDGKAPTVHGHAVSDVTGLQTALDGKAPTVHGHVISDVTGLQGALDGKAPTVHGHAISDVTGLQGAIDGKASTVHGHAIGDVTGLQTALDGKASSSHTHSVATTSTNGFMSSTDKTKLDGIQAGAEVNVNADWNAVSGDARILNKPTLGTAASKNVAVSGNAGTTEVVLGNDTRLTDARTPTAHSHAIGDVSGLQTALDGKLDDIDVGVTVQGYNANTVIDASYVHTDNNYTTTEKNKLAGIEDNANNYAHPVNHPASIITQDTNNRFVTDAEKVTWGAKQDALVSGTNIKTVNGTSILGSGNLVVSATVIRYLQVIAVEKTTALVNGTDIIGVVECPVSGTISALRAKTTSGTATVTFNKNGVSMGTVTATSSGVTNASPTNNTVTALDDLTFDVSDASASGLVLMLTIQE